MNKITFFSEMSQQTLKMYKKIAIITQTNLAQSKIIFYMHQWPIMVPDHGM